MLIASHFGRVRRRFAAAPHSGGKKTTENFEFIKDKSEMKLTTPPAKARRAGNGNFILTIYIAGE